MSDVEQTETIDKLFLELSQFTQATTQRECELSTSLTAARRWAVEMRNAYRLDSKALSEVWAEFDALEWAQDMQARLAAERVDG